MISRLLIRRAFLNAGLAAAISVAPIVAMDTPGSVFVATNGASGNAILVYDRAASGALTPAGSYPTGGLGTGGGLGNQGGLVASDNHRRLFAVNAASDDISVMDIVPGGLALRGAFSAGGRRPVSLAIRHKLLYVLFAGGTVGSTDGIAGFRISLDGALSPIPGSTRPLSAVQTAPAQISFSPDGAFLVVTEKATNHILTFPVDADGAAGNPLIFPSAGVTPFGFAFGKHDQLLVSEAFGGAPDAGVVSSYSLDGDGSLAETDPRVATNETAPCWVVVTNDGRFAYATNTGSGTVSGFDIARDGGLTLLDADGITASTGTGSGPIDMDLSRDGRNLYTLNGRGGTISEFRLNADGGLIPVGTVDGLPAGANGLVAR